MINSLITKPATGPYPERERERERERIADSETAHCSPPLILMLSTKYRLDLQNVGLFSGFRTTDLWILLVLHTPRIGILCKLL